MSRGMLEPLADLSGSLEDRQVGSRQRVTLLGVGMRKLGDFALSWSIGRQNWVRVWVSLGGWGRGGIVDEIDEG